MVRSKVIPFRLPLRHARLVQLLHDGKEDTEGFAMASHAAIREARTRGPAVATEAVVSVLDAYRPGGDEAPASRAAHVVHELQLEGAIPALIACLERVRRSDRLGTVLAASLDFLGPAAVPHLLQAFPRITDEDVRLRLGISLARARVGTPGVRAALESMLLSEPCDAAVLLVEHGDRAALSALRAALDAVALPPPGPDELAAVQRVTNLGRAIRHLRAKLDPRQWEKLERAEARYDELVLSGPVSVPR